MRMPTILVGTWADGLFSVTDGKVDQEFAGESIRGLAADGHGGMLAIVGAHSLRRRSPGGEWAEIAKSRFQLSCCAAIGDAIFVGTDDAHVLRFDQDGVHELLPGFDSMEGRDGWYAGAAVVDGRLMGPPLGVRSMAATCDGAALLANVHVGGIPRSSNAGLTWLPTIEIEADVHQVCTHPCRPELAIAAAADGLCISRDAGATWVVDRRGLHASYCSAVAFGRHDIFVAASADHFAAQGAVYRRPIDGDAPLRPLAGGFPKWLDGIADTGCIASRDATLAVIDRSGCLYVSHDDGARWACPIDRLNGPSGIHVLGANRESQPV